MPPPELLGQDLNLDFPHSGDSQSLTPFGSRQSSQSSHVGGYGLVLPSSTPDQPAGGGLQGDQDNNAIRDIDNLLQLDDPEFEFGEDGDIVEFTPGSRAPAAPVTPVASRGPAVHSDADASARVRQDHEEGRQRGEQVSFAALSHLFRTLVSHARLLPEPPALHFALHHPYTLPSPEVWMLTQHNKVDATCMHGGFPILPSLRCFSFHTDFLYLNFHYASTESFSHYQGLNRRRNGPRPTRVWR